jgi:hypothetical protein
MGGRGGDGGEAADVEGLRQVARAVVVRVADVRRVGDLYGGQAGRPERHVVAAAEVAGEGDGTCQHRAEDREVGRRAQQDRCNRAAEVGQGFGEVVASVRADRR